MKLQALENIVEQKILMIGIGFYDYEQCIAHRLQERGAKVVLFEDEPSIMRSKVTARLLKICPWWEKKILARHQRRILSVAKHINFDHVLVIKGLGLSPVFLEKLTEALPHAKFTLYLWDSCRRLFGVEDRFHFFQRVLSFDRIDTIQRPNMVFRPLFFRDQSKFLEEKDIDISFVGWLHSSRLKLIRNMQREARQKGLETFVYLYTGWLTWLKLAFKWDAHDIHIRPLSYHRLMGIIARSNCVFDLPHEDQTGLTMRAIEAIGSSKKLITTAEDIINYNFFNHDNICVFTSPEATVEREFVKSDWVPLPPHILRQYSIDSWLNDVFEIKEV